MIARRQAAPRLRRDLPRLPAPIALTLPLAGMAPYISAARWHIDSVVCDWFGREASRAASLDHCLAGPQHRPPPRRALNLFDLWYMLLDPAVESSARHLVQIDPQLYAHGYDE